MELSAEDGSGVMDQAFVGLVVEVGKILPPILRKRGGINSITMVLRRDVAFAGGEVESGNVVGAVAVF